MTASRITRIGSPIRAKLDGMTRTGEFAGAIDSTFGRVRIGHRLRTLALADIEVVTPSSSDRWADLHRSAH